VIFEVKISTQSRDTLNMTEFVSLLHLITSYKTGTIQAFPQVLHPDLFEAAIRGFAALQRGKMPRTLSSPAGLQSNSAELRGFDIRSQPQPRTSPPPLDRAVSPQDKAHFDSIFDQLDMGNTG
jgi:epidermal growth factor receptor substrate 15